jgi:hypothetical protein
MKKLSASFCFSLKTVSGLAGIFCIVFLFLASNGCTRPDTNQFTNSEKILIDASHDGGGWWFPQSSLTGFSNSAAHQGKALAELLRSKGFTVDELPRDVIITSSLLQQYSKVIRAGSVGGYQQSELDVYDKFLSGKSSLFLISDFKWPAETDQLAEMIGIKFAGSYTGYSNRYAPHEITKGATPLYCNAGSIVTNENNNPDIQILGWLGSNNTLPVMGLFKHPSSKIFFLGDINGIEGLPQPLTNNIIKWLFE